MIPVRTDETNFTYKLIGGTEENDLPCVVRHDGAGLLNEKGDTTSFWNLEDGENLTKADGIVVLVHHIGLRALQIGFGSTMEDVLHEIPLMPVVEGGELLVLLTNDTRKVLLGDGHFILRIPGHPTPPVSVRLA